MLIQQTAPNPAARPSSTTRACGELMSNVAVEQAPPPPRKLLASSSMSRTTPIMVPLLVNSTPTRELMQHHALATSRLSRIPTPMANEGWQRWAVSTPSRAAQGVSTVAASPQQRWGVGTPDRPFRHPSPFVLPLRSTVGGVALRKSESAAVALPASWESDWSSASGRPTGQLPPFTVTGAHALASRGAGGLTSARAAGKAPLAPLSPPVSGAFGVGDYGDGDDDPGQLMLGRSVSEGELGSYAGAAADSYYGADGGGGGGVGVGGMMAGLYLMGSGLAGRPSHERSGSPTLLERAKQAREGREEKERLEREKEEASGLGAMRREMQETMVEMAEALVHDVERRQPYVALPAEDRWVEACMARERQALKLSIAKRMMKELIRSRGRPLTEQVQAELTEQAEKFCQLRATATPKDLGYKGEYKGWRAASREQVRNGRGMGRPAATAVAMAQNDEPPLWEDTPLQTHRSSTSSVLREQQQEAQAPSEDGYVSRKERARRMRPPRKPKPPPPPLIPPPAGPYKIRDSLSIIATDELPPGPFEDNPMIEMYRHVTKR